MLGFAVDTAPCFGSRSVQRISVCDIAGMGVLAVASCGARHPRISQNRGISTMRHCCPIRQIVLFHGCFSTPRESPAQLPAVESSATTPLRSAPFTPTPAPNTQIGYVERSLSVTDLCMKGFTRTNQCVVILSKSSLTCTRVRASSYLTLPSLTRRARS